MKKNIIPYLIIAGLLFLLIRQCSETRESNEINETTVAYLTDSISYYKNEIGQIIAEKSALKGEKAELEILLSNTSGKLADLTEKFNNIDNAGEIETIVEIDTLEIRYTDTIGYVFSRDWAKNDKWYHISGKSTQKGVTIEKLTIPNTLSFVVGEKDGNYRIEAVNSNPYITTTGLDAYSLSVPKKRFGISLYAGMGISENFTFAPQIGVGVTWTFIRF